MDSLANTTITTTGDDNSTTSSLSSPTRASTIGTTERDQRKMVLIQKYSDGKTMSFNKSTLQSINRAVRKVLLPRMKFLSNSKCFGSFEQPDFSDPNCWVHRVFNELSTLKNAPDKKKAEIWMTYRSKLKEQFSLHRSSITSQIKLNFVKGK
jgi:hypothetical protein